MKENPIKVTIKKETRKQSGRSSERLSPSSGARRRPPGTSSSALRPRLSRSFSVGFFRRSFGNYSPTSTWRTDSGTHSSGERVSPWQPAAGLKGLKGAARVTPAGRSMSHALTRGSHPLRLCPLLSLALCVSRSVLPLFTTTQEGKREDMWRERERETERVKKEKEDSEVSLLFSVSPSLPLSKWDVLTPRERCALAPSVSSLLNLLILLPNAASTPLGGSSLHMSNLHARKSAHIHRSNSPHFLPLIQSSALPLFSIVMCRCPYNGRRHNNEPCCYAVSFVLFCFCYPKQTLCVRLRAGQRATHMQCYFSLH